jgi:hypothetical protein
MDFDGGYQMFKKIIAGLCLVALAGCVTLQPYKPAQGLGMGHAFAVGPYPVQLDYMHGFLDRGHTVLYMQNQGGGGAAVGLLLGPLGVAANIAAIKKQTQRDLASLQDKLSIDAGHLFVDSVAGNPGLTLDGGASAPMVSPVLLAEKVDETHVRFAALLHVQGMQGGKAWTRQYVYETQDVYTPQQLAQGLAPAQMERLSADAREGFSWAVATLATDVAGTFHPLEKQVLRSTFVTPRTEIPLNGYGFEAGPGRIGFATGQPAGSSVYSLLAEDAALAPR